MEFAWDDRVGMELGWEDMLETVLVNCGIGILGKDIDCICSLGKEPFTFMLTLL